MTICDEADWIQRTVGVRRLTEVAAIRVWGPDARSWLNGQITNQVAMMTAGDAVYALVVTIKGRVLSDLHVVARAEDDLLLLVPAARREALLAHFDKYIVMEDVDVAASDQVVVSAQGPRAAAIAVANVFPCARIGAIGRDVLCDPSEADGIEAQLLEAAQREAGGKVGPAGWELARLRALRPAYPADFDETTYPQEAGLKSLAVSFDKGCYLGQEVVCMLENRGQLRRRLVGVSAPVPLTPGAAVQVDDKKVGEIRSGALDPATGAYLAMAYVKRAHAEIGTVLQAGDARATVTSTIGN